MPEKRKPASAKVFKLTSEKKVLQSRVFAVFDERWSDPDGKTFQRHSVRHPGAVAILPVDADGNVLLIRQFRPALQDYLLEIPAGTLEVGEAPLACAKRELIEEIGFAAKKWQRLGASALAPGYCSEIIHIFKAWNLTPAHAEQDEDERIDAPVAYSPEKLKAAVRSGKIHDAKTLCALFLSGLLQQP